MAVAAVTADVERTTTYRPVCERHDLGLHGEVHNGVGVWWCRRFQHSVAPIGRLGEKAGRRASRKAGKR